MQDDQKVNIFHAHAVQQRADIARRIEEEQKGKRELGHPRCCCMFAYFLSSVQMYKMVWDCYYFGLAHTNIWKVCRMTTCRPGVTLLLSIPGPGVTLTGGLSKCPSPAYTSYFAKSFPVNPLSQNQHHNNLNTEHSFKISTT
eukprot:1152133-Pelagomonas_calceolata.AAC.3